MKKNIWSFFVITFLFMSCDKHKDELPQFPIEIELDYQILNDSFIYSFARQIYIYKNYIILDGYNGTDFRLHILDKVNGEYIKSVIGHGRGPNEVLGFQNIIMKDDGSGELYDFTECCLISFNLDSLILSNNIELKKDYSFPNVLGVYQGVDNYIGIGGRNSEGMTTRFKIINGDTLISEYNQYPSFYNSNLIKYYDYGHTIAISPDNSKMVFGSTNGLIFEFFEIKNKEIVPLSSKIYLKPGTEKDDNSPVGIKIIWGFTRLFATNDFVYAVYYGTEDASFPKREIAVFDWKGNPLKLYRTSFNIDVFVVDEHLKRIYATGSDENDETMIVYFDIEDK